MTSLVETLSHTKDRKYVIFKSEYSGDFLKWWDKTKWAVDPKNKTRAAGIRKIRWGEGTKSSDIWSHYQQVALIKTGEPFVQCNYCQQALSHPSAGEKNTGTTKLKNHLATKDCIRKRDPHIGKINFFQKVSGNLTC
jgi:hypothetical protein